MPTTHRVKKGDCLRSIAFEHGFEVAYLWNLAENAALKRDRKHPEVLLPGDLVHIPDLRGQTEIASSDARATFRLKGVPCTLQVAFDLDGDPRANEQVEVSVDGESVHGLSTNANGELEVPIIPNAKQVLVTLSPESLLPDRYVFELGAIDPIDSVSGQKARLRNLGLFFGEIDDNADDPDFKASIGSFQKKQGLGESCVSDATTQGLLESVYGS